MGALLYDVAVGDYDIMPMPIFKDKSHKSDNGRDLQTITGN